MFIIELFYLLYSNPILCELHNFILLLLSCRSAPNDYTGGSFDVSIPAGLVKVTLSVSTLRDHTVEPAEYFKVTLSLPGAPKGCVVGTPDMSYITILDNTRMLGLGGHAPLRDEL